MKCGMNDQWYGMRAVGWLLEYGPVGASSFRALCILPSSRRPTSSSLCYIWSAIFRPVYTSADRFLLLLADCHREQLDALRSDDSLEVLMKRKERPSSCP